MTKMILATLLLLNLASCSLYCSTRNNEHKSEDDLGKIFTNPLIAGASISAGVNTESPGRRLALRYTRPSSVATRAQSGSTSATIVPRLSEDTLKKASALIAVDLFFWDSASTDTAASIARLSNLIKVTEGIGLPVILGDVPELLRNRQPGRIALNSAIKDTCANASKCYLLKLDELFERINKDGYLTIDGTKVTLSELLPDGLHLSATASNYLADYIGNVVSGNPTFP